MKALLAFSAGVVVGAAAVLSGVCAAALLWSSGAASLERAGQGAGGTIKNSSGEPSAAGAAKRALNEEQRIDEELAQTFPASDPLPYSHQIN